MNYTRHRGNKPEKGENILGPKIRAARLKAHPPMSQPDLVYRLAKIGLNVDAPIIARIENGTRVLRDYEIRLIARALGVSVASLFSEE